VFLFCTLFFLSLALYVILAVVLSNNIQSFPKTDATWQPPVSLIIAARNEEKNLQACLSSLVLLDYPRGKMEIILVNDASTDRSAGIIQSFQQTLPHMHIIELRDGEKEKPGKAGALLAGIEHSRGKVIFITDADCQIPPGWIRSLLAGFQDNVGVVGGFTLITQARNWFERAQAVDWLYLLSVAAAASHMNSAVTWVGNNLAIRREAYDAIGGYRSLPGSVVEDFALVDAVQRRSPWTCRFYAAPRAAITTRPAKNLKELYNQRKRWSMGISGARPFGWLIMGVAFLTHLLLVSALFISPLFAAVALFVKAAGDQRLFEKSSRLLQRKTSIKDRIIFQPYFIVYSLVLPVLLLFDRRIVWKGEAFGGKERTK